MEYSFWICHHFITNDFSILNSLNQLWYCILCHIDFCPWTQNIRHLIWKISFFALECFVERISLGPISKGPSNHSHIHIYHYHRWIPSRFATRNKTQEFDRKLDFYLVSCYLYFFMICFSCLRYNLLVLNRKFGLTKARKGLESYSQGYHRYLIFRSFEYFSPWTYFPNA